MGKEASNPIRSFYLKPRHRGESTCSKLRGCKTLPMNSRCAERLFFAVSLRQCAKIKSSGKDFLEKGELTGGLTVGTWDLETLAMMMLVRFQIWTDECQETSSDIAPKSQRSRAPNVSAIECHLQETSRSQVDSKDSSFVAETLDNSRNKHLLHGCRVKLELPFWSTNFNEIHESFLGKVPTRSSY